MPGTDLPNDSLFRFEPFKYANNLRQILINGWQPGTTLNNMRYVNQWVGPWVGDGLRDADISGFFQDLYGENWRQKVDTSINAKQMAADYLEYLKRTASSVSNKYRCDYIPPPNTLPPNWRKAADLAREVAQSKQAQATSEQAVQENLQNMINYYRGLQHSTARQAYLNVKGAAETAMVWQQLTNMFRNAPPPAVAPAAGAAGSAIAYGMGGTAGSVVIVIAGVAILVSFLPIAPGTSFNMDPVDIAIANWQYYGDLATQFTTGVSDAYNDFSQDGGQTALDAMGAANYIQNGTIGIGADPANNSSTTIRVYMSPKPTYEEAYNNFYRTNGSIPTEQDLANVLTNGSVLDLRHQLNWDEMHGYAKVDKVTINRGEESSSGPPPKGGKQKCGGGEKFVPGIPFDQMINQRIIHPGCLRFGDISSAIRVPSTGIECLGRSHTISFWIRWALNSSPNHYDVAPDQANHYPFAFSSGCFTYSPYNLQTNVQVTPTYIMTNHAWEYPGWGVLGVNMSTQNVLPYNAWTHIAIVVDDLYYVTHFVNGSRRHKFDMFGLDGDGNSMGSLGDGRIPATTAGHDYVIGNAFDNDYWRDNHHPTHKLEGGKTRGYNEYTGQEFGAFQYYGLGADLDEFMVFSRALTEAEVKHDLYDYWQSLYFYDDPSLVIKMHFDPLDNDEMGTIVNEVGNDGISQNLLWIPDEEITESTETMIVPASGWGQWG